MPDRHDLPPELSAPFLQGLERFDQGDYFEAHDAWEEVWDEEVGSVKLCLQALIQLSVGLYHRERANRKGARKLFRRATEILSPLPDQLLSLDVRALERAARALAEELDAQAGRPDPQYDRTLIPDFRAVREALLARASSRKPAD